MDSSEKSVFEQLLADNPDWGRVMELSSRLGIQPLLHKHLSAGQHFLYVSDDIASTLSKEYRSQALRNLLIYGTLKRVLEILKQAGIPVILLKGAFLGKWIYEDIALRFMSDIDILCRPDQCDLAREELASRGGRQQYPSEVFHLSVTHREHEHVFAAHLPPVNYRRIARVEIHPRLFRGARDQDYLGEMWQESTEYVWDGFSFRVLSPEYQILHLCCHAHNHFTHGEFRLLWLCDIHEVLRFYGDRIDWQRLCEHADRLGQGTAVRSMLLTLENYWHSPLPAFDRKGAKPFDLKRLFRSISLSAQLKAGISGLASYRQTFQLLGAMDGWRNRFLFVSRFIFPSREFMQHRYLPRNRLKLYAMYAVRPCIAIGHVIRGFYGNLLCFFNTSRKRA